MERAEVLKRIQQVMDVEATVPKRQDFLLTHVPFRNLSLGDTQPITEERLFQEKLLADPDKHKTIMILGENGSGKSHLIRWLYEKYLKEYGSNDDVEKILWISKAHNTLQDALMQLLKSNVFPEEIRKNELEKVKNAQSAISGNELKKTINFNFTLVIENEKEKNIKPQYIDAITRNMLPSFLKNQYILEQYLMKENGPLDRICSKLNNIDNAKSRGFEGEVFTEEAFSISLMDIKKYLENGAERADEYTCQIARKLLKNPKLRKSLSEYMNSKVDEVIQRSLKLTTSDFKQLFWSLRTKLKEAGMRLTLFVEDINAFTGIDLALMDVLVANHEAEGNEDYCRLASVVGSTNDFYKNRLNDSLRDRVKDVGAEVYIREESLFGDPSRLTEFAAKYINACMITEEDIKTWDKEYDCDEAELPIAPIQYNFAREVCFGREMSIFPFNRTAISNMYEKLDSFSKTPRRFILDVLYPILNLYYTSPEDFLDNESAFRNDSITSLNDFKKPVYTIINDTRVNGQDAKKRSLLLRIWGDATTEVRKNTVGGLDKEVFDAFGIDMKLEQFRAYSGSDVDDVPAEPQIPKKEPAPTNPEPVNTGETGTQSAGGGKEDVYLIIRKSIGQWAKDTEAKLAYAQELRRIVCTFIYGNMEWDVEEVPHSIVESYYNQIKYVNIEGQTGATRSDGLLIRRNRESEYLLYAMLEYKYHGNNSWNFESGLDYYNIAKTWLLKHRNEILRLVTAPYEATVPYQEVLLASVYCVKLFNGGINKATRPEDILIEMFNGKNDHSNQHSDNWNSLYNEIIDILPSNEIDEYPDRVCRLFSNVIGTADVNDKKYIFVDAYKLLSALNSIIDSGWDLTKYAALYDKKNKQDYWFKAPQIVGIVSRNLNNLVSSELKMVKEYTTYFNRKIPNYTDPEQVEQTLLSVMQYLKYLTDKRNLSYVEKSIPTLCNNSSLKMVKDFVSEMTILDEIMKSESGHDRVNALARNPFDHSTCIYSELQYFDKLVKEKNEYFKSKIDVSVNEQIEKIRSYVQIELSKLISVGQEVGNGTNR